MKKKVILGVLVMGLSLATSASANWGRCCDMYYGYCGASQVMVRQQLDVETQAKIELFLKDTQSLHKEIAMKQAEERAIMLSNQVDQKAAAKVAGELFDLLTSLREKAKSAGVDQYVGPWMRGNRGYCGAVRGYGQGRGYGLGRGRYMQ